MRRGQTSSAASGNILCGPAPQQLKGCAVDAADTKDHHQIFSVVFDTNYKLPRLDYSICSVTQDENTVFFDNEKEFIALAESENEKDKKRAAHLYGRYAHLVKDDEDNAIFEESFKQAFTISFIFNPEKNFRIEKQFARPSQAKIGARFSYREVNDNSLNARRQPELQQWRQFITRQKFGPDYNSKMRPMPFEDVVDHTHKMVHNFANIIAFEENLGTIHNLKARDFNGRENPGLVTPAMARETKIHPLYWTLPLTTSKKALPAHNNLVFSHYLETTAHLFSQEVSNSIAHMATYCAATGNRTPL
ncbi:MAG: hypothetical protein JWM96_784 [Alphaproteobacteria bacterium]|nr:hypothetical protein [Alphaproteobacteria bacterium]